METDDFWDSLFLVGGPESTPRLLRTANESLLSMMRSGFQWGQEGSRRLLPEETMLRSKHDKSDVSSRDKDVEMMDCDSETSKRRVDAFAGPPTLTGHMARVPVEILEDILTRCKAQELACLEATCSYFLTSGITEKMAKARLQEIPRAKGLQPRKEKNERWLHLYYFVTSQSSAAAQSTAISSGALHTSALLVPDPSREGEENRHYIFTFGRGFNGQLGFKSDEDGEARNELAPKEVSLGFSKLSDDSNREEEIMPAVVSCGASHTISISRKGTLYGWGLTTSGELGLGTTAHMEIFIPKRIPLSNRRVVSVAAGSNHTLVITETGELWTCGRGRRGQLGHGNFIDSFRLSRVDALKGGLRIVSAAAGTSHSLALAADGSLYSWGGGEYGQLGHPSLEHDNFLMDPLSLSSPRHVEDLNPRKLAPQDRVTSISAGGNHTIALTVSGNLLAFGRNQHGQLGLGDRKPRWKATQVDVASEIPSENTIRVVQVVCGGRHTIVLALNWTEMLVLGTGYNYWGQMGSGDTHDRLTLKPIQSLASHSIVSVQSGLDHCCGVSKWGNVFFWGRGDCGQLGNGKDRSRKTAVQLEGYRLVHPDRTLRRANRCKPRIRPIIQKKVVVPKIPHCFRSNSQNSNAAKEALVQN
ncbi:hypothetical protein BSKO_06900 [Bryopsis sp. KO-2023]|nr:hypothetical protein BSKO_06900 [Bryopsis sp. KO-2023]